MCLLCASNCYKKFTTISSCYHHGPKGWAITVLILKMMKLRFREVTNSPQSAQLVIGSSGIWPWSLWHQLLFKLPSSPLLIRMYQEWKKLGVKHFFPTTVISLQNIKTVNKLNFTKVCYKSKHLPFLRVNTAHNLRIGQLLIFTLHSLFSIKP